MKKHLYKIILGVLFLSTVAVGIVFSILHPVEKEIMKPQEQKTGDVFFSPENYQSANNEKLYINLDSYSHLDSTTIRGILKDLVYKDDVINKFVIEDADKTIHEIKYSELDLISTVIEEDENGLLTLELTFRTGGKAKLTVGDEAMLYQTYDGMWSLDKREHVKSDEIFFSGTIDDFVFLPVAEGEEEIYISHIIVTNEEGEKAEIYANSIYGASIKSLEAVDVYYTGETTESRIYDVDEGEDYKIELITREQTYTLQKGMEIDLVKRISNGYWEIYDEADTALHKAKITGFTFGDHEHNIVSLDYINLEIENGKKVQLTMLQTGAVYAIPYGNYTKTYTYFAHEKVLTGIDVSEDWRVELYFEDDTMLELSIDTTVWVRQNEDGIWYLEYTYQEPEEKADSKN